MSVETKIMAARTRLILNSPFFGSLILRLKMKADPTCKTAWVDGRTLGYNPAFVGKITSEELQGVLVHEVEHVALGHPWRRDARQMKRYNVACDLSINKGIEDAGFTLPQGALMPVGDQIGKSAEWIYARLPDEPEDEGGGGELGEVRDAPTTADEDGDPAPTEGQWKERVAAAATLARMQGKDPAGLDRLVEQALKPRIDVRSLLLRFFSERSRGDYSWARPNARYIPHGLYLPSLESKDLGEVAIMVDTSGSVDATSLSYARGIVEDVIDQCNPLGVTVYYADAKVTRIDRFERGEPLVWRPVGGGGTDFRPALSAIEKEGTAVCALCITDLYGTFGDGVDLPVMWLSTTENMQAPFGETIFIDR